ncbi:unnamed protein product [Rotaria sp. Silwood1]|nr:unnamed protein product [Rotaria sp. Silwood1]
MISVDPLLQVVVSAIVYGKPESIRQYHGPEDEVICMLSVCQEYFKSLKLDAYFQQKYDCYCKQHYSDNNPNTVRRGGYEYTIPREWVRVRIQTDRVQSQQKKIFQSWTTSYYGMCEKKLEQILRNRFIPLPGDLLNDGNVFSDDSGYEQQWLTSPSINYASDSQYSPIKTFKLPGLRREIYNVQVVLQCKQKPGTFTVQPGRPRLCDIIPANVIEWTSNQRSTLIPYGLMIRMFKK